MKRHRDHQQNDTSILQRLLEYLRDLQRRGDNQLPAFETLERMIKRVENGKVTELDLLIQALFALEQKESRQKYEALELEVRSKRELNRYFEGAIKQAIAERDARSLSRFQELQRLLNEPPATTRTISSETVEEVLKVYSIKKKHPEWTYPRISTELYGDPSHAERLKKAVQRIRKAMKKSA